MVRRQHRRQYLLQPRCNRAVVDRRRLTAHFAKHNAVTQFKTVQPTSAALKIVMLELLCKQHSLFSQQLPVYRNVLRSLKLKPLQQLAFDVLRRGRTQPFSRTHWQLFVRAFDFLTISPDGAHCCFCQSSTVPLCRDLFSFLFIFCRFIIWQCNVAQQLLDVVVCWNLFICQTSTFFSTYCLNLFEHLFIHAG